MEYNTDLNAHTPTKLGLMGPRAQGLHWPLNLAPPVWSGWMSYSELRAAHPGMVLHIHSQRTTHVRAMFGFFDDSQNAELLDSPVQPSRIARVMHPRVIAISSTTIEPSRRHLAIKFEFITSIMQPFYNVARLSTAFPFTPTPIWCTSDGALDCLGRFWSMQRHEHEHGCPYLVGH